MRLAEQAEENKRLVKQLEEMCEIIQGEAAN